MTGPLGWDLTPFTYQIPVKSEGNDRDAYKRPEGFLSCVLTAAACEARAAWSPLQGRGCLLVIPCKRPLSKLQMAHGHVRAKVRDLFGHSWDVSTRCQSPHPDAVGDEARWGRVITCSFGMPILQSACLSECRPHRGTYAFVSDGTSSRCDLVQ